MDNGKIVKDFVRKVEKIQSRVKVTNLKKAWKVL
jgi:hypothetical protein